jgi:hypothetical protein
LICRFGTNILLSSFFDSADRLVYPVDA